MRRFLFFNLIVVSFIFILSGCDTVYKYVFVPTERIEYTLVPNVEFIKSLNDTTIKISKDGNSIIIDKKDFKIELKYISDYQLNNFEFPEESKGLEYSKNPFTYGNWVDPELGYTPNRFSVFKISIFNYTASKLNFNPEDAFFETDRGDKFRAYAREKKESQYNSLEEYFLKRKGKSGVDDEVFESRMGIARRTMIFFGKPIYAGDSKEGFLVFDPIDPSVDFAKVSLTRFILGYDENNEPTNFADFSFYFKKVPFDKTIFESKVIVLDSAKVSGEQKSKDITALILRYNSTETRFQGEAWNPMPNSIPSLLSYVNKNSKYTYDFSSSVIDPKSIKGANLLFLIGGYALPDFNSSNYVAIGEAINSGAFLYIDNSYVTNEWPYVSAMKDFLTSVSKNVKGQVEIKKISINHEIFSINKKFSSIPKGYDDNNVTNEKYDYVEGMFIDGKLRAILSNKGYFALWSVENGNEDALDFGLNIITYILKKK